MAKALAKKGDFEAAYSKMCAGMSIDYDDDAAEMQKVRTRSRPGLPS